MPRIGNRIALFGGSFDPPHAGHLEIARAAVKQCGLAQVVFIPCRESPLKGRLPEASGAARLAMLRLALTGLRRASVSDWELCHAGPSYSWQTTEHFAAQYPTAALHWLMGSDQWRDVDKWARPEFLRDHLTFIVFPRDGIRPRPRHGWRSIFLPVEFPGSSTEARRLLGAGTTTNGLVPAAVEDYAISQALYSPKDR